MHANDTPTPAKVRYLEVDRGHDTPCWEWQMCKRPCGYGQVRANGKTYSAHRWYYEQKYGPIPKGLQLDHLCRNRSCVNPDHLEAVTCAENIRRSDVVRLPIEDIETIKSLQGQVSGAELGRRYGVARSTINRIWRGEQWLDPTG